jgi:hypothetical protein
VKTLSDEQLSEVIQRDTTKWAVTNKEFLMEVARAVSEAQAKLTAEEKDTEIAQLKDASLTYCAYCGAEYSVDAKDEVSKHILCCQKHPLFHANQRIAELERTIRLIRVETAREIFREFEELCLKCALPEQHTRYMELKKRFGVEDTLQN